MLVLPLLQVYGLSAGQAEQEAAPTETVSLAQYWEGVGNSAESLGEEAFGHL